PFLAPLREALSDLLGGPRTHERAPTLASLRTAWRAAQGARYASVDRMDDRWRLHLAGPLGGLTEAQLGAHQVELVLAAAGLGAHATNHLRADLRRVIRAAQAQGRWKGLDPTAFVPMRRPARKTWR